MRKITSAEAQALAKAMGCYIGRAKNGIVFWYVNEPKLLTTGYRAVDSLYGQLPVEIDTPGVWLWRPE